MSDWQKPWYPAHRWYWEPPFSKSHHLVKTWGRKHLTGRLILINMLKSLLFYYPIIFSFVKASYIKTQPTSTNHRWNYIFLPWYLANNIQDEENEPWKRTNSVIRDTVGWVVPELLSQWTQTHLKTWAFLIVCFILGCFCEESFFLVETIGLRKEKGLNF